MFIFFAVAVVVSTLCVVRVVLRLSANLRPFMRTVQKNNNNNQTTKVQQIDSHTHTITGHELCTPKKTPKTKHRHTPEERRRRAPCVLSNWLAAQVTLNSRAAAGVTQAHERAFQTAYKIRENTRFLRIVYLPTAECGRSGRLGGFTRPRYSFFKKEITIHRNRNLKGLTRQSPFLHEKPNSIAINCSHQVPRPAEQGKQRHACKSPTARLSSFGSTEE